MSKDQRWHKPRTDVLFVVDNLMGGGAERAAVNLANGFCARGYRVAMVIFKAGGIFRDQLDPRIDSRDLGGVQARHALLPLIRQMRSLRPRSVISFLPPANIMTILAARLAIPLARVVVTEHNQADLAMLRQYYGCLVKGFRLSRFLYPLASAVTCCAPGIREDWITQRHMAPNRVFALNNAVLSPDTKTLSELPPSHPWARDRDIPVILAAGRLEPEKDHATLLRAFARLRRERSVRLILVGQGRARADLEALAETLGIAADISMPGFVDNPYSLYRHIDLLAISSVSEGMPNVLIEAMACGTGAVATQCLHPLDQKHISDWLYASVPVGDDAALAGALANALDHPRDPAALAGLVEGFTIDAAVDGYEAVVFPKRKGRAAPLPVAAATSYAADRGLPEHRPLS